MTALIELHYLPSLEYFCCLLPYKQIRLEGCEHFIKQTYRSRCYIQGANNVQMLNIPVVRGRSKTLIRDLQTDNRQPWMKLHWRSLKSAYGNAPFFEFYEPRLHKHFSRQEKFLVDFTLPLLTLCLEWLNIQPDIVWTDMYEKEPSEGISDLRSVISAKSHYSERTFYQPEPYPQVFGKNFAPNLSIVDLLSCEGPNAASVLRRCARV